MRKYYSSFKNIVNLVKLAGHSMKWVNEVMISNVIQSAPPKRVDLSEAKSVVLHLYHRVS